MGKVPSKGMTSRFGLYLTGNGRGGRAGYAPQITMMPYINHSEANTAENDESHEASDYRKNHPDFIPNLANHLWPHF
jgi:hypothetical protein